MGGSAKKVLAVAVAVAIPFAAPAIAGVIAASTGLSAATFGLSATAGATLGSAAVGAGLGAINAKVTGGDVGRGALMGGIGGGFGGYASAQAAQAAQASAAAQPGINMESVMAGGPAYAPAAPANFTPNPMAQPGLNTASIMAGGPAFAPAAAPTFSTAAPATAAAPTPTFMEALAGVPGEIAGRFSDPSVMADMTLRAAGSLLSGELAGDGLSPEEQELLQAQMADLQQLREQDEELFKTRVQEAMGLLGEARYFDPAQFGFQAQAAVQRAGAQQMREAERDAALTPGRGQMSASDRRRAGLDIAARGQTAYAQGAESGQKQRLATYQAGLAALPNAGPTQGLSYGQNLMDMYGKANERKRQVQGDIGDFFGSLTGVENARRTDDRGVTVKIG